MGYTHYFGFANAPRGKAAQTEKTYQKAIAQCNKVIQSYSKTFGGLAGYSAHSKKYAGINVNGSERVGACEPFELREHYNQNETSFCKTRQYPYDTVVTACLIIMKHHLGDSFYVTSDGNKDNWNDGLILAQSVLRTKKLQIPFSIRANERAS